ncbi:hypothetical protein Tco_0618213, partial [Tanacetum coccineum]
MTSTNSNTATLPTKKEHDAHLRLILELLKKEELYAKFSKCEFWLSNVKFLGHVIDSEGIHINPVNIESIKDWESPKTPTEIRQFLGSENFIVYCDASHKGLGAVLMQKEKILNAQVEARKEENYGIEDLCGMIKNLEPRADGTLSIRIQERGPRVYFGARRPHGQKKYTVIFLSNPEFRTSSYVSLAFRTKALPIWGKIVMTSRPRTRIPSRPRLIMTASAIAISSDSSDESVGSPPSRVILFGNIPTVIPSTFVVAPETSIIAPVISSAAPMVETTLVASPTGLCGLIPYSDSDFDSPDEMSSPEHISPLPAISPFLCTDSSEAPDSSDGPPSQDPYVAIVARWRSRVIARPSSSSEFPIAPVTALLVIRRWSAILIQLGEAIPFGRPYRTHPNGLRKLLTARNRVGPLPARRLVWRHASPRSSDHHPSSSSLSSDSSPVH